MSSGSLSCLLALRHAGLAGSLCHGICHSLGHAGVERAGDDVLLAAVSIGDEVRNGVGSSQLHLIVDIPGADAERALEQAGEALTNPKIAQIILTQYGGPDGELGASMRYLSQRYTMPYKEVTGILTDIGTEELAHLEMICAIVHQLTRDLTPEQLKESGFDQYYVDHTLALWPQAASGTPWSATTFQSKGDPITDLHEDLAADGAIV